MENKLKSLKVGDLKDILQKSNLSVSGKKEELIQRILQNQSTQPMEDNVEQSKGDHQSEQPEHPQQPEQPEQPENNVENNPTQPHNPDNSNDSDAQLDRKKARAERFGQSTQQFEKEQLNLQEQAKKDARAARFGVSTQPKTKNEPKLSQEDEELRKKREAKFGPVEKSTTNKKQKI
ncbi:hypothetical protein E3P81_01743 [Wallemia ichthyophaga]|nr:hypothetical protein E3P97_01742 [Wallemia ichthyophaga]TIB33293.1 hypothetical protein E3P85_01396 [Wallemia ichthyophaga]TIB47246.1 hypothetical protein E3P82_01742 [Wallemia ichthyophaga]TIB51640.1 hypothetical protein E3P81_01743 [Wallemia ichthyophaga]TIB54345.1 hypothetical protein E3P80_01743 [Wallemia ichthyophaga]